MERGAATGLKGFSQVNVSEITAFPGYRRGVGVIPHLPGLHSAGHPEFQQSGDVHRSDGG
jgi:hypothetical protein